MMFSKFNINFQVYAPTYGSFYVYGSFLRAASSIPRNEYERTRKREEERVCVYVRERARDYCEHGLCAVKQSVPMYGPMISFPDDIELDAQVSAKVSPGAGQRHLEASLLHVQELRFQGDGIHRGDRLSEREGESSLCSDLIFFSSGKMGVRDYSLATVLATEILFSWRKERLEKGGGSNYGLLSGGREVSLEWGIDSFFSLLLAGGR